MPATYMKETIVSQLTQANIYTALQWILLAYYYILFYLTGITGIFTIGSIGVPSFGWLLPTFISALGGLLFSQKDDELLSFPLAVLNFMSALSTIVMAVHIQDRLQFCYSDPGVNCTFANTMILFLALFFVIVLIIINFLAVAIHIQFSQSIDESLKRLKFQYDSYNAASNEVYTS